MNPGRRRGKSNNQDGNDLADTYVCYYISLRLSTVTNGTDGTHHTRKPTWHDPLSRFLDLEASMDDANESEQQEEEDDGTSAQI
jgi:hypothetical protein